MQYHGEGGGGGIVVWGGYIISNIHVYETLFDNRGNTSSFEERFSVL